jgi:hypothetical protein
MKPGAEHNAIDAEIVSVRELGLCEHLGEGEERTIVDMRPAATSGGDSTAANAARDCTSAASNSGAETDRTADRRSDAVPGRWPTRGCKRR